MLSLHSMALRCRCCQQLPPGSLLQVLQYTVIWLCDPLLCCQNIHCKLVCRPARAVLGGCIRLHTLLREGNRDQGGPQRA